ncbi:hypothetical protein [Burkholderia stagnalis]|uniref:hypothetical protein n=1 Tax=Burkholderia stagnalis TaxID=1503054 RepID=UPI00075E2AE6|nr:hypothetical protein [Burkholderia stagnalis]KVN28025.1 hypothetical protein WT11_26855 [Burkholderia stagnalis]KVX58965.1 hypothetical protein WT33_20610 [Burkholderia stagnalis]
MKIYENVVVGNFLYALGFAIRARQSVQSMPSVVNLLQQTPSDTLLGDLLLQFPGVVRLLEFKVDENRSSKERARHASLSSALSADPALSLISRRIHWYIEAGLSEVESLAVRAVPYLDAYPRTKPRGRFEPFIEALADEVVYGRSAKGEAEAAMEYIRWVKRLQGEGKVGTGGLLLVANADGSLHYAQLLDLLELRIEHRMWIELHQQRLERELTYQRELALERGRVHERSLEREGPEMRY